MKREIGALLLLGALIAASVWNIHRADTLISDVEEHVALSEKAVLSGDSDYAAEQLDAAFRIWLSAKTYTQTLLRHTELDGTSDAFYAAMRELKAGEIRAVPAVYDQLRYHLDCIAGMEKVSWGTVF